MGPGAGGRGREAPPRTLWPLLPGASRRRDPAASEQPPAATTTGPGARGPGPPPASCARTAAPAGSGTRSPSPPPRRPRPSLARWLCSLHPRAARSSPSGRAPPTQPWPFRLLSSPHPHAAQGPLAWSGQLPGPPLGPSCRFRRPALAWVGCPISGQRPNSARRQRVLMKAADWPRRVAGPGPAAPALHLPAFRAILAPRALGPEASPSQRSLWPSLDPLLPPQPEAGNLGSRFYFRFFLGVSSVGPLERTRSNNSVPSLTFRPLLEDLHCPTGGGFEERCWTPLEGVKKTGKESDIMRGRPVHPISRPPAESR